MLKVIHQGGPPPVEGWLLSKGSGIVIELQDNVVGLPRTKKVFLTLPSMGSSAL